MKVLVLAQNLEKTAPGSVFKNIINGLSLYCDVDLLFVGDLDVTQLKRVKNFIPCRSNRILDYIERRYSKYGSANNRAEKWSKKAIKAVEGRKYDVVCVMLTSSYYFPFWCGKTIAEITNAKYAVYSVDAIPAPGWGESDFSRFQLNLIKRELPYCDFFATINEKMLEYQLSTFDHKPGLKYSVINMTVDDPCISSKYSNANPNPVFLYTGGVYGKRKIDHVIHAFMRLCKDYPEAKLVFIGSHMKRTFVEQIAGSYSNSIELYRYKKDLTKYYENSTVLLSVDADIPHDVFLASKLMKYLPINRQIICETSPDSPTHSLLDGLNSVIICNHDENEIYQCMLKAINNIDTVDYSDRDMLLKMLSIDVQGRKLFDELKSII